MRLTRSLLVCSVICCIAKLSVLRLWLIGQTGQSAFASHASSAQLRLNQKQARSSRCRSVLRKCGAAEAAVPVVLTSSLGTEPSDFVEIMDLLNMSGQPRLVYVGTAKTAPRKSDRPLKEQRKKRRYEARRQAKVLASAISASSVEHLFLEDFADENELTASDQLAAALKISLGSEGHGVLVVDGGNTFWLWYHAKKAGLMRALQNVRASSSFSYVGISAGAILAGFTCDTAYWKGWDDPGVVPAEALTKTLDGLGLVSAAIFPHHGPKWEEVVSEGSGKLPEGSAVLCIGEEEKKLEIGKLILTT